MVTDKDAIVSMVKAQSNMRIVLDRNSELKKALKTLIDGMKRYEDFIPDMYRYTQDKTSAKKDFIEKLNTARNHL
jgi:hypothetical protein